MVESCCGQLQYVNGPIGRCNTTLSQKTGVRVTVTAVAFRSVMERASTSFPFHHPTTSLHQTTSLSVNPLLIRYCIPTQEADNALVTPPESRVYMDNVDHL
ncbi:hypothetical protein EVAR_67231_1 [Eumeta japonica]|uniref:Uncharacterized protein n=1 Tax=Eumeta variegata TaxID=151549 RepID=A0A4C1YVP3_EUMVA|nr:hypothetical protein EVAR_67231_1 [Eumeta japonica]